MGVPESGMGVPNPNAGNVGGTNADAHCSGDGARSENGAATPPPAGAPPPDASAACAPTPIDAGDASPVALGVVGGSGP